MEAKITLAIFDLDGRLRLAMKFGMGFPMKMSEEPIRIFSIF